MSVCDNVPVKKFHTEYAESIFPAALPLLRKGAINNLPPLRTPRTLREFNLSHYSIGKPAKYLLPATYLCWHIVWTTIQRPHR